MKQKHFPKDVMVNGNLWAVKFVRHLPDTKTKKTFGICDPSDRVIYIRQGQDSEERLDTFFHELVHAIECEFDIDIEHKLVDKLGAALARVYVENF